MKKLKYIKLYCFSLFFVLIFASTSIFSEILNNLEFDHVLICYQAELNKKLESKEKYELALSHFPKKELYKLFIDKAKLTEAKERKVGEFYLHKIFDTKEPGYYKAMMKAFDELAKDLGNRLTFSSIEKFHNTALSEVYNVKRGWADTNAYYGIPYDAIDYDALYELLRSRILDASFLLAMKLSHKPLACGNYGQGYRAEKYFPPLGIFNSSASPRPDGLAIMPNVFALFKRTALFSSQLEPPKDIFDRFLNYYYDSIKNISSLAGKLSAIAELIRALEVSHIFEDGNQRTYAFIILNKLLIEQGIPPAILEDPFMFDGFMTVAQMSESIKIGVRNFLNENPDGQREFLKSHCPNLEKERPSDYITASSADYITYYTTKEKIDVQPVIRKIENGIDIALSTGQINEGINNDSPLDMAVLIGSTEYVNKLLDKGADAFGPNFSKSSYALARSIGSLEIAQLFLDRADKNSINQNFVKDAIYDESNIVYSRALRSLKEYEKHSKELLELMGSLLHLASKETLTDEGLFKGRFEASFNFQDLKAEYKRQGAALLHWQSTMEEIAPKLKESIVNLMKKYQLSEVQEQK